MRRYGLILALLALVVMMLSACGETDGGSSPPPPPPAPAAAAPAPTAEPVDLGKIARVLVPALSGNNGGAPPQGYGYLPITLSNSSNEQHSYAYDKGKQCVSVDGNQGGPVRLDGEWFPVADGIEARYTDSASFQVRWDQNKWH